ncbi:hypothetical protein [Tsukamurella tyrosinosolvens]|uniref:hypothetical protein n=1 Tax=Tsukamurella tyrosinosolvens TaxID=57704 RepID=UPI000DF6BC1A|nr:hypothetical protein [Tsukamurella tyrosinosolvens]RDB49364.1 hypothetical protein DVB87_03275 [Tsukamurella tyrosinosolvens]
MTDTPSPTTMIDVGEVIQLAHTVARDYLATIAARATAAEIADSRRRVDEVAEIVVTVSGLLDDQIATGQLEDTLAVDRIRHVVRMYADLARFDPATVERDDRAAEHAAVQRLLDGLQPLAQRDGTRAFIDGARTATELLTGHAATTEEDDQ